MLRVIHSNDSYCRLDLNGANCKVELSLKFSPNILRVPRSRNTGVSFIDAVLVSPSVLMFSTVLLVFVFFLFSHHISSVWWRCL